MTDYTESLDCRICTKRTDLLVDLGPLALTSRFPHPGETVPIIPVTVRRCSSCGLVQLGERTNPELMYREGYGYKSGINEAMSEHLRQIVFKASRFCKTGDYVLDIGCNDGTLLRHWATYNVHRVGYDPIGEDCPGSLVVKDYFKEHGRKYQVITSIAMFYDLQDPVAFARDVSESLTDDGVWILEVGYAGAIVEKGCWDGICHEHLTYYGLTQIKDIADRVGLKVMSYSLNDVNGGSLQCVLHRKSECDMAADLAREAKWNWNGLAGLVAKSVAEIRQEVIWNGQRGTFVVGASTKGNMVLQLCGLDYNMVEAAIERNPDKIGRLTPGTNIPIRSEEWMRANNPKALLVLPYHFRSGIMARYKDVGAKFIFPLPALEVV